MAPENDAGFHGDHVFVATIFRVSIQLSIRSMDERTPQLKTRIGFLLD